MSRSRMKTDALQWNLGPFHEQLPGPMLLKLDLLGEHVDRASVETGYLHRGLERAMEKHSWKSAIPYSDHLDPEAAVFGEMAYCMALESLKGIQVPVRAEAIRVLLCELTRVSTHMAFIAKMARICRSETTLHFILRDREKVLDLFELLTGARFSVNFLRFGGVASDVTEGFLERVLEICELIRVRIKEYNDLFSFNYGFLQRTAHVGVLPLALCKKWGITGPNARASGEARDLRKTHPYSGYARVDFVVPVGSGEFGDLGDCHDRFLIRLREMLESVEIVRQVAESLPSGEYLNGAFEKDTEVPPGEAFVQIESPRGQLSCHAVSDGTERPCRVQFKGPSTHHLMAIPELLRGASIEDVSVILASLDPSLSEVDR